MSDVARAAGVSPMTVSNVVNGRPGVSDAVRRRVLEHVGATGYRMNVAARNLRSGRSGVIGLAVPELDRSYFAQLGAYITAEAKSRGYRVAVEETGAAAAGESAAIELSQALQYDGLILSSVEMDLTSISAAGTFPLVVLGEREGPEGLDHIRLPNREGARAVVTHLVAQGARRIVYVGGPDSSEVNIRSLRLAGYRDAIEQLGPAQGIEAPSELHVRIDEMTMAAGRAAGHQVASMPQLPSAIFAITDTIAIGVVRGLSDCGIRVPQDILVAGFDDIPESQFMTPSLTTITPDHQWTARRAVELLLERVAGTAGEARGETAPFVLTPRESTDKAQRQPGRQ